MTIKEAIKESGTYNPLIGLSIKEAERQLHNNESVLFAMNANVALSTVSNSLNTNNLNIKGKLNGVFVITNERVYFSNNSLGTTQYKSIQLSDIQSVDDKANFLGLGVIRIKGITEEFVIDVAKKLLPTIKDCLNEAIKNQSQSSSSTESSGDYIHQIEQLSNLLNQGIISQEEFDFKKKQLLGM